MSILPLVQSQGAQAICIHAIRRDGAGVQTSPVPLGQPARSQSTCASVEAERKPGVCRVQRVPGLREPSFIQKLRPGDTGDRLGETWSGMCGICRSVWRRGARPRIARRVAVHPSATAVFLPLSWSKKMPRRCWLGTGPLNIAQHLPLMSLQSPSMQNRNRNATKSQAVERGEPRQEQANVTLRKYSSSFSYFRAPRNTTEPDL